MRNSRFGEDSWIKLKLPVLTNLTCFGKTTEIKTRSTCDSKSFEKIQAYRCFREDIQWRTIQACECKWDSKRIQSLICKACANSTTVDFDYGFLNYGILFVLAIYVHFIQSNQTNQLYFSKTHFLNWSRRDCLLKNRPQPTTHPRHPQNQALLVPPPLANAHARRNFYRVHTRCASREATLTLTGRARAPVTQRTRDRMLASSSSSSERGGNIAVARCSSYTAFRRPRQPTVDTWRPAVRQRERLAL